MRRVSYISIFAIAVWWCGSKSAMAQSVHDAPLAAADAYFEQSSSDGNFPSDLFTSTAQIFTITYDESGKSSVLSLDLEAFKSDFNELSSVFRVRHEPVVLVARTYGGKATFFCSVHTRLIDKATSDTVSIRSVQSLHLVNDRGWKINHIAVQNENAAVPISDDLWPTELTKKLRLGQGRAFEVDSGDVYNPHKIYKTEELDLKPLYPGSPSLFESLLSAFEITLKPETDSAAKFEVIIGDDGLARIGDTSELNDKQKQRAEAFVGSMLVWYPAVKDKASVNTTVQFFVP